MAMVKGTVIKTLDYSDMGAMHSNPAQRNNVQSIDASGAAVIERGKNVILLNHATQITATIADASYNPGLVVFKQTSTGTAGHTVTLTIGNFDGTNNKITLNAIEECIAVFFDPYGNGTIIENVGSVALAAV
jgi:hypothetical protein